MVKHVARNLTLALAIAGLTAPAVYASGTKTGPVTNVTGGDPEPISPHHVIHIVLAFLHLV
jgi:hypothetical protein